MPGLSTLQCYCSGYAFHLQASSGQSAQSNLARDRLSLLPCVAKKVLEITSSKHRGFGRFQGTHCHGISVQRRGHFPAQRHGRRPRNAQGYDVACAAPSLLSGPLDRLNAILSLLQPLDRYRTPSAIGSAIGRPLSRPIWHPRTGRSPQPPRSKPLRGAQPRDSGAIVSQTP